MIALIGGIIIGVVVAALLFNPFFPNDGDFKQAIYYYFKPDLLSAMSGEYHKDRMAEMKIGLWLILSGLAGFATFAGLTKVFGV